MHNSSSGGTSPAENDKTDRSAPSPPKRQTGLYIILAVSAGLLVNIFMGLLVDSETLLAVFRSATAWLVLVPFTLFLLNNVIDGARLTIVSRQCGTPVRLMSGIGNSVLGNFFSNITPLAAGGQPFQIVHLRRKGVPTKTATNIILSRFVVNAMILMTMILIGLPVITRIAGSIRIGAIVFYIGLGTTFVFAMLFLAVLIQPRIISSISTAIAHTKLGRLIGRLTKKPDWNDQLKLQMTELRDEVRFLWSKGFRTMFLDILLNILNIVVQGLALWYPLSVLVDPAINFMDVLIIYIVIWQVVFYIPSPGASGGLEGMLTLVLSTLWGSPEKVLAAIILWRVGSYYIHLVVGLIVSGSLLKTKVTAGNV